MVPFPEGTFVRHITVDANLFSVTTCLDAVYAYTLKIQGLQSGKIVDFCEFANPSFIRNVLDAWWRNFSLDVTYAFDGRRNVYTHAPLPIEVLLEHGLKMQVDFRGPVKPDCGLVRDTVYVQLAFNSRIDCEATKSTQSVQLLSALDAIVAAGFSKTKDFIQVGRTFVQNEDVIDLGDGVEAWRGYNLSLRRMQKGLMLNMDEKHLPFWACGGMPLTELLSQIGYELHSGVPQDIEEAAEYLNGIKLLGTAQKSIYKLHGFTNKAVSEQDIFDYKKETKVPLVTFYKEEFGVTLKHPFGVCAQISSKEDSVAPVELLEVAPLQKVVAPLSDDQTAEMIRACGAKPIIRASRILQSMNTLKGSDGMVLRSFRIEIGKKLVQVPARILHPPLMLYPDNLLLKPSYGKWNKTHENQVLRGATINRWCILNCTPATDAEVAEFISKLLDMANHMAISMKPGPRVYRSTTESVQTRLRMIAKEYADEKGEGVGPLEFVIVVVPNQSAQVYNNIKCVADTEIGVASQVLQQRNLNPEFKCYIGNLLLKINTKMDGTNTEARHIENCGIADVPFAHERHIVLGLDVTHPVFGSNASSIAAMVGSRDLKAVHFTGSLRQLPPRCEMVHPMSDMFREVYGRWLRENGEPNAAAIVVFRDGVGEGQFGQVLDVEISALRQACAEIDKDWHPRITFIVVTKRHHIRFFPLEESDHDRSGNLLPGTVIDADVVSAEFPEFYLFSHCGIAGTSRPSKYTVLLDENNIPKNVLQLYCYRMAHGFARCCNSVSLVTPVYYAHLLAKRGRAYSGKLQATGDLSNKMYWV